VSTKVLNIALHPRAVTPITQTPKVVGWNDTKLAHLDEGFDFGLAERIFAISMAINRAKAV
jgi:hypothetical protein